MSDLLALHGYNKVDGTEKMIAVLERSPNIYNSATGWSKAPITLTANQEAGMVTFLDHIFLVNGVDDNYTYDGTTWSTSVNLTGAPKGYHIASHKIRIYLLDVTINSTRYRDRVWYSDLPENNVITWGLETGSDLAQTAGSGVVTSVGSLFETNNIKVGDPLTIEGGTNAGEYIVQSIDSETQITLTVSLGNTTTNSTFWVGGNYFDLKTDDGDVGEGFGENSNELLVFKRNSLHRYSSKAKELRQIKDAPGTTSKKSIVNLGDYTYYYHSTGIYRTNGTSSILASAAIQDAIDGVLDNSIIVGWEEEKRYLNMFLGSSITLRDGEVITNCVAVLDTLTEKWSFKSLPFTVQAATHWLESNVHNTYVGDSASKVYKMNTGTIFGDNEIPFLLQDQPRFPLGSNVVVNFDRVLLSISNGLDVQLQYKLHNIPTKNDDQWIDDVDWQPLKGSARGSLSEFSFPLNHKRAAGVSIKAVESSSNESFLLGKFVIYYSNAAEL